MNEPSKDYKIPLPEENPVGFLVFLFKCYQLGEVNHADRKWDIRHWARSMLRAKELLEIAGGNQRLAESCLADLAEQLNAASRSWNFETINNLAHAWIARKRGTHGNTSRTGISGIVNNARAKRKSEGLTKAVSGREILNALGDNPSSETGS